MFRFADILPPAAMAAGDGKAVNARPRPTSVRTFRSARARRRQAFRAHGLHAVPAEAGARVRAGSPEVAAVRPERASALERMASIFQLT